CAAVPRDAADLARRLPARVRFGTSSWSFPGWKGLVYSGGATETSLAREGLREYAQHPLLRTVGIDRSYYAPIPDEDLRRYASQLPSGFLACAKAPALVTSAELPGRDGGSNPEFMSARRLIDDLLAPVELSFAAPAGPFILEFPPVRAAAGVDCRLFVRALDRLLGALPPRFRYAVELRNRQFLTPDYARSSPRRTTRVCWRRAAPATSTTTGARCRCPATRRRSSRPSRCRSRLCVCCSRRARGTTISAPASR